MLRKRFIFILFSLCFFLSNCSTHTKQSDTIFTQERTPPPPTTAPVQVLNTIAPPPIEAKTSVFLQDLTDKDLILIRREATRTMIPIWSHIDARSIKLRHRVLQVLEAFNAPKELQFIPIAESGYNPYALSPAGALGLWQLMPRTATELGAHHKNGIDDRRDIQASTKAAVSYLLSLHQRFDSWPLAICAYNLGPWGVERRLRKKPWSPKQGLNALPFPAETKHYVKQILGIIALAQDKQLTFSEPLVTQDIKVDAPIDLKELESISGLQPNELFHLNPEFDYQHYMHRNLSINLPEDNAAQLQLALANNPDIFKPKFMRIRIQEGDSLWILARKHHTSIRHLKRLNPQQGHLLSIGKSLVVPLSHRFASTSAKANPLLSKGRRIRYKVKSGDSLWKIAKKFGTSTHAIARTNQISRHHLIRPGDKLWVIARFQPS